MNRAPLRVALNTGGGDCPGLNAVLRAAALAGIGRGWEMYGIRKGYGGLLDDAGIVRLDRQAVRGITHLGGTILGTTNRGNPFDWPVAGPDGTVETVDRSDAVVEAFHRERFDALIAIGGDGSLRIASRLAEKGVPVIGVPKTIDNDLAATELTFGFQTAVQTATDALDKLHSTAESHERVMVVEVMGRHTGWIALRSGLAATADVILIPEIPYDLDRVCDKVRDRYRSGRRFAIVVAAEGARPRGGEAFFVEAARPGASARYGGIAERLAAEIAERTGYETRSLVLGHLQRGGSPVAFDRFLALRFGAAAVRLVGEGSFGRMVALQNGEVTSVPLETAIAELKRVSPESDSVLTGRDVGISFGD